MAKVKLATPQSLKPKGKPRRIDGELYQLLYSGGGYKVKYRQEDGVWIIRVHVEGQGHTEWETTFHPHIDSARDAIDIAKRGIVSREKDHLYLLSILSEREERMKSDEIFYERGGWGASYRKQRLVELVALEAIKKKGKRYALLRYGAEYLQELHIKYPVREKD